MKKSYVAIFAIVLLGGLTWYGIARWRGHERPNADGMPDRPNVMSEEEREARQAEHDAKYADAKEFSVKISEDGFTPTEIRVAVGDPVRLTLESSASRIFRLPQFHIATMVGPGNGSTYEFEALEAGVYEYYLDEAEVKGSFIVE